MTKLVKKELLKKSVGELTLQERELLADVHDLVRRHGLRLVAEATVGLQEELAELEAEAELDEAAGRADAEHDAGEEAYQQNELESWAGRML